jgi:Cu2+-exporting ATPase
MCRKRSLAESVLTWLTAQAGVKGARINYDCASLVLDYDPAEEQRLRFLLDHFRTASLADIKALAESIKAPATPVATAQAPSPSGSKRFPLALPTLSLVMAFSATPAVVALNMPAVSSPG